MFCPNCGTKLADDAMFCANCGTPTGVSKQPIPQQPVQQQPIPQQPVQPQPMPQQPVQQQPIPQQPTYAQPVYQQPTYAQPVYQQQPVKRGKGKLIVALIGGVAVVAAIVVACILIFGGSGSGPLGELVSALQKTLESESFDLSISTTQIERIDDVTTTQKVDVEASLALNLKKKTISGEVDVKRRLESSWYGPQTDSASLYVWNNTSIGKDNDGWYAEEMDNDSLDVLERFAAIVKSDKPIDDLVDLIASSVAKKSKEDDFKDFILEFYDRINSESWLEKNCEFDRTEGKNGTTWTVELRSIEDLVQCMESLFDLFEKVGITEDDWEEMKDTARSKDGKLEFCLSWTIQDGYLTAIELTAETGNLEDTSADGSNVTAGVVGKNAEFAISIGFDSIGNASCDLDEIEGYYQQAINN